MSTATVGGLTWVAIYFGLIVLPLGVSVRHGDPALGWALAGVGSLSVLVGLLLIWFRSRMKPVA